MLFQLRSVALASIRRIRLLSFRMTELARESRGVPKVYRVGILKIIIN